MKDLKNLITKYVPNRNIYSTISRVKKLLLFVLLSSTFIFSPILSLVKAIEGPGPSYDLTPKVTLTIVDNIDPTTPILISPTDNSYVTTGTPTFVWEESTDDRGISKYQWYLKGS